MQPKCPAGHHWEDSFLVPDNMKFGTYYARGAESLDNIKPFLKKRGYLVIQAGGHVGAYPRKLSMMFEKVITVEANPAAILALKTNTSHRNVRVIAAALGEEVGDRVRTNQGIVAEAITIDSLEVDPDLICLDLDGGEPAALRGAVKTVARSAPIILMEETTVPRGSLASYQVYKEACDWLIERGYTMEPEARCGPDRIWRQR